MGRIPGCQMIVVDGIRRSQPIPKAFWDGLGKVPNSELSKRYGVKLSTIHYYRRKLGIPSRSTFKWTKSRERMLGRYMDTELAAKWGCSHALVFLRRKKLGIPPYCPPKTRPWFPFLGKESDAALAAKFGVACETVRQTRIDRGIPRCPRRNAINWTEDMDEMLGEEPDYILAKAWGISGSTVRDRRIKLGIPGYACERPRTPWNDRMVAQLGKRPDRHLAREWGLGVHTIATKRRALKIPPCPPAPRTKWTRPMLADLKLLPSIHFARKYRVSTASVAAMKKNLHLPPTPRPHVVWSKTEIAMLGKMTDQEVAVRLGIGVATVFRKRAMLGIPRCRSGWPAHLLDRVRTEPAAKLARELRVHETVVRYHRKRTAKQK